MPKIALFLKFNFQFVLKLNFNGGQFQIEIFKILLFQIVGKSQNKVGVAEKIGCGNDKVQKGDNCIINSLNIRQWCRGGV